jgi:DNA-directed RNA polymerase specialized sigma24 family protein
MISPVRSKTEAAAGNPEPLLEADPAAAAITSLQPFDRFIYVLSVLEKYSNRECAMLLDCKVGQVVDRRTQALRRLVSVGGRNRPADTALTRGAEEWKPLYGEVS